MAPVASIEHKRPSRDEILKRFRQLQAELAAANPDLTDEDWASLADRWAADVKAGLVARANQHRIDIRVEPIPAFTLESAYASIPPLDPPRDLADVERLVKEEKVARTVRGLRGA